MSAFLADLRRTLLHPVTIAILVVAVVLATIFSPPVALATANQGTQFAVSYEYHDGWVFQFFVFNDSGVPVPGATVTAILGASNFSQPVGAVGSGTTNSAGLATVSVPGNDSSGSIQFDIGGAGGEDIDGTSISEIPAGVELPCLGTFTEIDSGPYGLVPKLMVFDPDVTGGITAGSRVVIDANYSGPDSRTVNLSSIPLLGPAQVVGLPSNSYPSQAQRIDFLLVGAGGDILAAQSQSPTDLQEHQYSDQYWGFQIDTEVGLWGFVAPLLGAVAGYSAYGRDRSSRALEPVLGLPTTKLRILARRYVAGVVSVSLGLGLAAFLELQWKYSPSHSLSPALLLTIFGALVLEATAFLGLTFLLSHLFRSAGAAVGLGATLAALLSFFLVPLAYVILGAEGETPYSATLTALSLSPPTHLANGAVTGFFATLGSPFPTGTSVDSTVFVPLALALTMAAATPMLAAFLATQRD